MINKIGISAVLLVVSIFPAYGSDTANSIIKRAQKDLRIWERSIPCCWRHNSAIRS